MKLVLNYPQKRAFPNFDWSGYSKSKFVKNLPKTLQNKIKNTVLEIAH